VPRKGKFSPSREIFRINSRAGRVEVRRVCHLPSNVRWMAGTLVD
jgi:hypothetical protein